MQSSVINIFEILNSAKRFVSSGFSTGYSFDEVNAGEYFNELLENSAQSSQIFSGIIILEKNGDEVVIVDGLQRITTVCILLCALCENYKNTTKVNEETREKIFNRFLMINGNTKLYLSGIDQEIYRKIVSGDKLSPKEAKNNIYKAYLGFLKEIKEKKVAGSTLFKIVSKIKFMTIISDRSEVSAREIYEVLNNKEQAQVNLITDFLKAKCKSSANLWLNTINTYKMAKKDSVIDEFIRDFLVVQNEGHHSDKKSLYNKFKSYFTKISKYLPPETIVENFCAYAKYYLKIVKSAFADKEIKAQVDELNKNKGQDAYPYLMEVLDDLENGHITKEVFLDILTMINSFIAKRNEEPALAVSVNFASLSKELNRMLVLKDYTPKIFDDNQRTINNISKSD